LEDLAELLKFTELPACHLDLSFANLLSYLVLMLLDLIAQLTDGFITSIDHNDVVIGGSRLYTPCFEDILDDLEVSLLG
jgi:hypothetical protein